MKLTGVAAGMLAVVALAGCSSGSSSTHSTTPHAAADRVAYLAAVQSRLDVSMYDDAKLVGIAHSACTMLDTGSTTADVINTMTDNTNGRYTHSDLAYWVGAATSAYCPEHSSS